MKNHYSDKDVFRAGKDSFNVAFGIYNIGGDLLVDESIGHFTAFSYEEGWDQDGNMYQTLHSHDFHQCSREELGLDGDNSSFFPVAEGLEGNLESVHKSLYCLDDPSSLRMWGNRNSENLSIFTI